MRAVAATLVRMGNFTGDAMNEAPEVPAIPTEEEVNEAQRALDAADATELYALWKKSIRARGRILETMGLLVKHYAGDKDTPRFAEETPGAVAAIERIALAAIDLAKSVALRVPAQDAAVQRGREESR